MIYFYLLRGDAVNVAARMEQSGLAGQIQVTRSVVDNAGSDFSFELRGTLAIKGRSFFSFCNWLCSFDILSLLCFSCPITVSPIGKGPMDVYMLKSVKPSEKWRHSLKWSKGPRPQGTLRSNSMFI